MLNPFISVKHTCDIKTKYYRLHQQRIDGLPEQCLLSSLFQILN